MIHVDHLPAVIFVFAMGECPACEHYLPRLVAEADSLRAQGYTFAVNPKQNVPTGTIPILIYDAASPDVDVQKLADRYGVTATPTTIVVLRDGGGFRVEGSLANNQITWLLLMASEAIKK
jgi:thiol-disulfide isomerase/thioredoxin